MLLACMGLLAAAAVFALSPGGRPGEEQPGRRIRAALAPLLARGRS
jgi:hypothetical protein